jgi:hypothetical protein
MIPNLLLRVVVSKLAKSSIDPGLKELYSTSQSAEKLNFNAVIVGTCSLIRPDPDFRTQVIQHLAVERPWLPPHF